MGLLCWDELLDDDVCRTLFLDEHDPMAVFRAYVILLALLSLPLPLDKSSTETECTIILCMYVCHVEDATKDITYVGVVKLSHHHQLSGRNCTSCTAVAYRLLEEKEEETSPPFGDSLKFLFYFIFLFFFYSFFV